VLLLSGAKRATRNRPLERRFGFFDVSTPEEELKEIIKMDSAISKAQERLDFVTQDKEVLREYHLREMALSDWTTGIDAATEKGIEIGIVQGAMQKQIEIARNLLADGMSIERIHKVTGLDMEIIQSL
jgi:predicted transposase/invertase (TIGR01784 family)